MMPHRIKKLTVSMLIGGLVACIGAAWADEVVAPAPAAAPVVAPAAMPAPAVQPVNVLVLPLEMYGATPGYGWMGQAVQQSLNSAANGNAALHTLTLTNAPATIDVDAVTKAAKEAGASIVVFGSYRVVEPDVSIVGYLMDVPTGRLISAIKGSGPIRALFSLEDQLNGQFIATMGQQFPAVAAATPAVQASNVAPAPATPSTPSTPPPPANTLAPLTYSNPSSNPYYQTYPVAPQYTQPDYGPTYYYPYDYSYPYYSPTYYYPYSSFGFGFGFNNGFHHHDFGHDFHHSTWSGSSSGFHGSLNTGSGFSGGSHFSGGMGHGGGHR